MPAYTPVLLQHVNLAVPRDTLHLAREFYGEVIGFEQDPVPQLQKDILIWYVSEALIGRFRIGEGPQQIHVSFERSEDPMPHSSRHPCFQVASPEALLELQKRIWAHSRAGSQASALQCDEPGAENSGAKGVEYPSRFFVRDYAGNRLEFSAPSA